AADFSEHSLSIWYQFPSGYNSACSGRPLAFVPWLPFGIDYTVDPFWMQEDCMEDNRGYTSGAANPIFWGWQPTANVVSAVTSAARSAGLALAYIQLTPGMDLMNFPVLGRMIYDNTTSTNVLAMMQSYGPA